jgi:molecular chaperone GrpE
MEDELNESSEQTAAATENAPSESAELSEIQRQRDDYYDRLLRKTAEFDNYRKRVDRERVQLAEAAASDLLEELLPLVDDLERALKADAGWS